MDNKYLTDEEIEQEFKDWKILEFDPTAHKLVIDFPNAGESVGGGTNEVVDYYIQYENGKVAFNNWYPDSVYLGLVDYIKKNTNKLESSLEKQSDTNINIENLNVSDGSTVKFRELPELSENTTVKIERGEEDGKGKEQAEEGKEEAPKGEEVKKGRTITVSFIREGATIGRGEAYFQVSIDPWECEFDPTIEDILKSPDTDEVKLDKLADRVRELLYIKIAEGEIDIKDTQMSDTDIEVSYSDLQTLLDDYTEAHTPEPTEELEDGDEGEVNEITSENLTTQISQPAVPYSELYTSDTGEPDVTTQDMRGNSSLKTVMNVKAFEQILMSEVDNWSLNDWERFDYWSEKKK